MLWTCVLSRLRTSPFTRFPSTKLNSDFNHKLFYSSCSTGLEWKFHPYTLISFHFLSKFIQLHERICTHSTAKPILIQLQDKSRDHVGNIRYWVFRLFHLFSHLFISCAIDILSFSLCTAIATCQTRIIGLFGLCQGIELTVVRHPLVNTVGAACSPYIIFVRLPDG
jgi:hypothetical protein